MKLHTRSFVNERFLRQPPRSAVREARNTGADKPQQRGLLPVSPTTRQQWLFLALVAVFFAITSPYGAVHYLPFIQRLIYWLGLVYVGWIVEFLLQRFSRRHWPKFAESWWQPALASLFTTPCVFTCILIVQAQIVEIPVPRDFYVQLLASVWLISFILAFGNQWFLRQQLPFSFTKESVSPLLQRLPKHLQGQALVAVRAEDHYVSIITSHGSALVHMKFSDALLMLANHPGLKVHRSWWVATDAVASLQRRGGRLNLLLTSGQRVPVSRNGQKLLKECGLFQSS